MQRRVVVYTSECTSGRRLLEQYLEVSAVSEDLMYLIPENRQLPLTAKYKNSLWAGITVSKEEAYQFIMVRCIRRELFRYYQSFQISGSRKRCSQLISQSSHHLFQFFERRKSSLNCLQQKSRTLLNNLYSHFYGFLGSSLYSDNYNCCFCSSSRRLMTVGSNLAYNAITDCMKSSLTSSPLLTTPQLFGICRFIKHVGISFRNNFLLSPLT
ncbi:Hybrid PKS-NRPS synthetase [Trichinella pseudospiralis]